MNWLNILPALILALSLFQISESKPDLTLGTGGFGFGCGSNSPAVQLPYSFVRLGPDTTPLQKKLYFEFQHFGGYSDADHAVRAFSHMHLVGAGVIDMGIFGILPTIAQVQSKPPPIPTNILASFTKDQQVTEPGYYCSTLSHNIKAELTTSQRCGSHRYTYFNKKNKPMDINIMTSYLLQHKSPRTSMTKICGKNCLEGQIWVGGGFGSRFGGYNVHFHLQWKGDEEFSVYLYEGNKILPENSQKAQGNQTGAILRTKSNSVELFIGISYVSIANARQNFEKEIQGKNFDQIAAEAKQIWKQQLSRFDILAISPQVQTKIDTAIYRTLLTPTIFQDWNGQYVSFKNDGSASQKPQNMNHVYTDMSLWDVHRSQMPWLLFQDPQRFKDIARSIVLINRQGQYMPKWPFAQGATGCMIGAHANTVISDWVVKEGHKYLSKEELQEILQYMLRNANNVTVHDSRSHIQEYIKKGYIAADFSTRSSCSETLQYSYNDFGISQVAGLIGETETQKQFVRRSKFYENVWNPQSKFFQPRFANGTFLKISPQEHINPLSNHYVEGDAWHYRFYAPHDAQGLIKLFGGDKEFVTQLNKFFGRSFSWPTFWLPNPYYWAGNQHDLFSVWLFPFANRSDLTQKYSRAIIDEFYGISGSGLPGNDDYATMSAWLIFACLGFYPLPSTQTYILGSPYIHYAKIMRKFDDQQSPFQIRVLNNSHSNVLVSEVRLNGKVADKFINHTNLQNGYLEFNMKSAKKGILSA